MSKKLPITEELDFHYLLGLMPPLHMKPEFAWLPELFSIIGHESLINLCRFAGGEIIQIPTLNELSDSIEALQWFHDIDIKKVKNEGELPLRILDRYHIIKEVYHARNS